MKKILIAAALLFYMIGYAYAETIYCKVDTAFICSSSGCKQIKSEIISNFLNFK